MAVLVFILGLVFGSFLNVCIYRIPEGESIISPPSHCPGCQARLQTVDLIPVLSFLFLRGRCRYCGRKIPLQYPFVELLTGIIFTLLYHKFGLSMHLAAFAFLSLILLATFFVDLKHSIIPDEFVIAGLTGGGLFYLISIISGRETWWNPILGIVTGSGVLLLPAWLSLFLLKKEGMGGGDIKIMAVIGIFLGWKLTLLSIFLSVLLGGLAGALLMLLKQKKKEDMIPFGPFIVLGTFLSLFFGHSMITWYLSILFI